MRRRELLSGLGGAVAGWSCAMPASVQATGRVFRIAVLDLAQANSERGLRQGLRDLGYVEGVNVTIEARYAGGREENLPGLAAEIISRRPDLVTSGGALAVLAMRRLSPDIRIVMTGAADPVGSGLVESLSRPGGNTTGMSFQTDEAARKLVSLLKEAVPTIRRFAVLAYRNHPPTKPLFQQSSAIAAELGLEIKLLDITAAEVDAAFRAVSEWRADGLVLQQASGLNPIRARLAELALSHKLPAIHESRTFAEHGGLMSFGANAFELGRRAATYVDRILKGAWPGDLPVEQPAKLDFVVNLKTAAALGLTIPPSLLARADEVIE